MKISRELKTGIIGVMGIVTFVLGFSYLKSSPIFDNSKIIFAVYDHVDGLQTGTIVSINGLAVGKVKNIQFKDAKGKLVVTMSVNNDFNFSKNSKAQLYSTSPIGGKGIQIIPVFDGGSNIISGDTLNAVNKPGLTEMMAQELSPLKMKMEGALTSADSLLLNFNSILDATTKNDLQISIAQLKQLMISLNKTAAIFSNNKQNLDATFSNLEIMSSNFANLSDTLVNAGFSETLSSLKGSAANLDQLLTKMNKGEGTLGKLMNDQEMYTNLNESSRQLQLLLQDFRLNPKRYVNVSVFGKKQKEYSLPESDPAVQSN